MASQRNITRKIFLFKNLAENEAGRLVPKLFFLRKAKALYEVIASGLELGFNIF